MTSTRVTLSDAVLDYRSLCARDGLHATIRYEADLRDTNNAWLRLHYRANGEAVDYKVQLVTTKPNYGGRRWWFHES